MSPPRLVRSLELKIPPALGALAFGVAISLAAAILPAATIRWTGARYAGLGFAIFGMLVILAGLFGFLRHQTTIDPMAPERSSVLVTTGIYRLSRNPMYLGMLLVLAGWALLAGTWIGMALLPLFVVAMNVLQIAPEERVLEQRYGETYRAYRERTRRWI